MTATNDVVIEAVGLTLSIHVKGEPNKRLLDSIDLTIKQGESVAILGRSGSGKTSLLSILGAMQRPESGTLMISGVDVTHMSESAAARLRNEKIGFVFQSYSLIAGISVLDNVSVPLNYGPKITARVRRQRSLDSLDLVGMSGFASSRPARLSGGEQQRVAIARALVRRPRILLADEPTGALDEDMGNSVIRELRLSARRAGSCLIVVTHDRQIADLMDRQIHLQAGRAHEAEPPRSPLA